MATVTKEPAAAPPSSVEDEAVKRNTDCVYFLASPLTCKKGSECEYRHSEYARVNPRDCWYWLNGNCLNPKCSFRHPPLDTLMGPQAGNFAGPSLPVPPVPVAPPVSSAPQGAPKQRVPCIFFQKGYCLKGDLCPFMHGPAPLGNKAQQVAATTTPVNEPPTFKKAFGGLEKFTQTKANIPKVAEAPPQAKATPKFEAAFQRDGLPSRKRGPSPSGFIEELPKYKETSVPNFENGNSRTRSSHAHRANSLDDRSYQNNVRDADDGLRESSPGFDVLVDDKLRGDEYYQHEDQYMRMRGHDGRSLNEFEIGHRDDYNSVGDIDPELYHNRSGYDSYDRLPERYAREQRRVSSERLLGEPAPYDRRDQYNNNNKSKSPDFVRNSDLRHRLSNKQRRVNGLKSVVNPDYNPEKHTEEIGSRASRRDSHHSPPPRESSRGSRLEGRIKLPRRSSPVGGGGGNLYSERENERERNWGRSSPSRPPQVSSQQGRLRDRLSSRVQDERIEGRGLLRGPVIRRDSVRDNGTNFSGPKSLAELKGKETDLKQQQSKGQEQSVSSGAKLRDTILASSVGVESNLSFDGPKPLSEILKRKRGGSISTSNKEESKRNNEHLEEKQISSAPEEETQVDDPENNKPVNVEGDEEEGEISNKKVKVDEGDSSIPENKENPYIVEGSDANEGEEEQGLEEEYDQGDVEYEYEQDEGEGEGYNLNEGENAEHEEDFMDDDDGDDDFAKKLGVSI